MTRKLCAVALVTAFLLLAAVGSGIMGETLSGGNVAIARSFTDTFAGIFTPHAPVLILAQIVGVLVGHAVLTRGRSTGRIGQRTHCR